MIKILREIQASLQARWKHRPEETVGLPVLSLALLSMLVSIQYFPIPGDASGIIAMMTGGLVIANVASPLGYHFRRLGKERLSLGCVTTTYAGFFVPGLLAALLSG